MARTNSAVSVGASATLIAAANPARVRIIIQNNGTGAIYIGDASVTTANGFPVAAGTSFSDRAISEGPPDLNFSQAWYGIAGGATDVRVIEG